MTASSWCDRIKLNYHCMHQISFLQHQIELIYGNIELASTVSNYFIVSSNQFINTLNWLSTHRIGLSDHGIVVLKGLRHKAAMKSHILTSADAWKIANGVNQKKTKISSK